MQLNRPLAIQLFKRSIPDLVADACQLEGINFTVPEVQTLLGGMTVGGKSLHDQAVALNQIKAWHLILDDLRADSVEITQAYSNKIHAVAAANDALQWGSFRTGNVTIAGTAYLPPNAAVLEQKFEQLMSRFVELPDGFEKGIFLFLKFAKHQFYFDNNKRQGRFMMNAYLLDLGLPAISIPKQKEAEFNQRMIEFYESASDDQQPMVQFLLNCIPPIIAEQFE